MGDVAMLVLPHYGDSKTARGDIAILIFPYGDPETVDLQCEVLR